MGRFHQEDDFHKIADKVEELLQTCGIPGIVREGAVYEGTGIEFRVDWNCYPKRLPKCLEFRSELARCTGYEGGITEDCTVFVYMIGGRQ